ncbi:MAG: hypothetical protein KF726_21030 [Anaerolineae bacterium]|nr:hypothetical protein [Anaerolineae bacterium]
MTNPIYRLHTEAQDRSRLSFPQAFVPIPYLLAVFVMWVSLSVVIVGALAFGKYTLPLANPFSIYADIFPGQSTSSISAWGFLCDTTDASSYSISLEKECRFSPTTGIFSRVDVTISDDTINQISFIVRENILRMGDFAQLSETTDFRVLHSALFFSWHGNLGMASITSTIGRSLPFRFVWKVAFTDMNYPPKASDR